MKKKVVVALSGTGRSLKNLLDKSLESDDFEVCGVITSSQTVLGVKIAKDHGLDVYWEKFGRNNEASSELSQWLSKKNPDLIVLGGFLKIFPCLFSTKKGKVAYPTINIHPSLLPKFAGRGMFGNRVHQAVLEAGETITGASVHVVTEIYDEGPLLAQIRVPVREKESVESLSSRVFEAECYLYPQVVKRVLTGELPQEKPLIFTLDEEGR